MKTETNATPEAVEFHTYQGLQIADLEAAFDKLRDPDDWKAPIAAWIPHQAFKLCAAAVEFYTATDLKATGGPELLTGRILVEAIGYRRGPAGDH